MRTRKITAPPQKIKVHVERVFSDTVEYGVHTTIDSFTSRQLVNARDDVGPGSVQEDVVSAGSFRDLGFLLRRGRPNHVRAQVSA